MSRGETVSIMQSLLKGGIESVRKFRVVHYSSPNILMWSRAILVVWSRLEIALMLRPALRWLKLRHVPPSHEPEDLENPPLLESPWWSHSEFKLGVQKWLCSGAICETVMLRIKFVFISLLLTKVLIASVRRPQCKTQLYFLHLITEHVYCFSDCLYPEPCYLPTR